MSAVSYLKDKDSSYWVNYTEVVRLEVEVKPPLPNGEKSYYVTDGGFSKILSEVKELSNEIKNQTAKSDIEKACKLLQEGITNHDVGKFFEAHEIIHDYDYWVINAPPSFVSFAPADWTGTHIYFGKATVMK